MEREPSENIDRNVMGIHLIGIARENHQHGDIYGFLDLSFHTILVGCKPDSQHMGELMGSYLLS